MAKHLALNDGTLDTYLKIMEAVRTLVRASRGWNVSSEGDPMDVDAMTKSRGKGKKGIGKGGDKGKSSNDESKDATDNQSNKECLYCKSKGYFARHCKKIINDEKAEAGQLRDNLKRKGTGVKQRVAALETDSSKCQAESVSSVLVSSLLLTPAQLAAAYAQMARQVASTAPAPAAQCEAILQDGWPDTDSDFVVCIIAEIDEQQTEDVWILYDTGSSSNSLSSWVPGGFDTGNDNGEPRCEAATKNAVTLGGAREVPMDISDTNFSFRFRVANVTKPIVSAEGLFQAGCTTVISKTGGCYVITPSGQAIALHRQQRTFWLKGRIGTGGEL